MKLTQNYEESFFTRFAKVAKGHQTDSKRREKRTDRMNLKGEFTFFIRELDVPPIRGVKLDGSKKIRRSKIFHCSIFWGVPRVIHDAWHPFLPFKLISPPYMISYQFSSYLKYFQRIVGALRHSSSFPLQVKFVTHNMKIGGAARHP